MRIKSIKMNTKSPNSYGGKDGGTLCAAWFTGRDRGEPRGGLAGFEDPWGTGSRSVERTRRCYPGVGRGVWKMDPQRHFWILRSPLVGPSQIRSEVSYAKLASTTGVESGLLFWRFFSAPL